MRGQLELPALGIALLLLTAATVVGVTVAHASLAGAERPTLERETAVTVSDRLVAPDSPVTHRQNVLNTSALPALEGESLTAYGLSDDADAVVQLDDTTLASTGTVEGGTTVERIVLVEERTVATVEPPFDRTDEVTLPRRSGRAAVTIRPDANATVERLRVNDRIVRANASGLTGTFDLDLSRLETATLHFEAGGTLEHGDVHVEYYPPRTHKATLQVTVDG